MLYPKPTGSIHPVLPLPTEQVLARWENIGRTDESIGGTDE